MMHSPMIWGSILSILGLPILVGVILGEITFSMLVSSITAVVSPINGLDSCVGMVLGDWIVGFCEVSEVVGNMRISPWVVSELQEVIPTPNTTIKM